MLQRLSKLVWIPAVLLGAGGAVMGAVYLGRPFTLAMLPAVLVLACGNWLLLKEKDRRVRWVGFAAGAVFFALQLCGKHLDAFETIGRTGAELLWLLAASVLLAPAAGGVFAGLVRAALAVQRRSCPERRHPRLVFWGSAAVLLLCWLPYLLAFYPGLFTYDISWQYQQYQNWELNTHHPLLHTLMVGGFCDLGREWFGYPVKGLLMYTLFQMALLAFAIASAVRLLYSHRSPAWTCWLVLAASALLPFNPMLAISSTKDTLFAAAVLYLCVLLMEMALDDEMLRRPGWIIRFVFAQAAVGLMRNNGFICLLAIVFAAAVGLIRHRKTAGRLLVLALCGLLAYSAAGKGLQAATGAEDGHFREMLSVPLQQMARVHHLTEDAAKPEIEKWLPTVELYTPKIADLVKNTFEAEKQDLPQVLRLWAQVGLRHPVAYVDSLLLTSDGFHYIDAAYGQYLETRFHENETWWLAEDSKWPALKERLVELYSLNGYRDIPVFSRLLSPALWVWVLILAFLSGVCTGNRAVSLAGTVLGALYLTALLSPCVMVRYVYPFMLTAPLLLGGVMIRNK